MITTTTTSISLLRADIPVGYCTVNGVRIKVYGTQEFLRLIEQFLIRVGGPSSDVDLFAVAQDMISADAGSAPERLDSEIIATPLSQDGAASDWMIVSRSELQSMVQQIMAAEMTRAPLPATDPLSYEITMGER